MNIEVSAPAAIGEGTALPPPRPFRETNTLTLPQGRRGATQRATNGRVTQASNSGEPGCARLIVVPADPTPFTITFHSD